MICPHGHDEGMVERRATPDEVDAGCELGIAFDPCPGCEPDALFGVPDFGYVDELPDLSSCAYFRRGLPGADPKGTCSFGCREEPACFTERPIGGWPGEVEREHQDYDHQAETGQGPPA